MSSMSEFELELRDLINRHRMENESNTPDFILAEYMQACTENGSNTPDFILAEYMQACLENFVKTIRARDVYFYGVELESGRRG